MNQTKEKVRICSNAEFPHVHYHPDNERIICSVTTKLVGKTATWDCRNEYVTHHSKDFKSYTLVCNRAFGHKGNHAVLDASGKRTAEWTNMESFIEP